MAQRWVRGRSHIDVPKPEKTYTVHVLKVLLDIVLCYPNWRMKFRLWVGEYRIVKSCETRFVEVETWYISFMKYLNNVVCNQCFNGFSRCLFNHRREFGGLSDGEVDFGIVTETFRMCGVAL